MAKVCLFCFQVLCFRRRRLKICSENLRQLRKKENHEQNTSGRSRGGARGARAAPLFFNETEARRAKKYFFRDRRPLLSQGLDYRAPPLSEGLGPPLNMDRNLMEMEEQLREKNKQLRQHHKKEQNLQSRLTSLEKELRDREQDIVELQRDLSEAKEKLSKWKSLLTTREWLISRDEIEIMRRKVLGEGGYGKVFKGRYRGFDVAIKELKRDETFSSRERDLFEREMDIASRCRHPCLLQFIGATQDEKTPLFVTELMELNLRKLLGRRRMSEKEIVVISLDIAHALNYLHQRKPNAIVHRDVSSANVLLWKQNGQWRGKLGDYGTVKFLQEIMTAVPGAMIYSAPEIGSPHHQTVKVSFLVVSNLLIEIHIFEVQGEFNHCNKLKDVFVFNSFKIFNITVFGYRRFLLS